MNTFNQILKLLGDFAIGHQQVNSNGNGFFADINDFIKNNQEGAFLFFQPLNIRANTNTLDYVFRIFALDFKQKDNENINDVLSDTSQILLDLRKYLIYNESLQNVWSIQFNSVTLNPVNNFTADYCAGWSFDITISTPLNECDGDLPFIQNQAIGDVFPIVLVNGQGCTIDTITSGSTGGSSFQLPTMELFNELTSIGNYPLTGEIILRNSPGVNDVLIVNNGCRLEIDIANCDNPFPIEIQNTSGCTLSEINSDPSGVFVMPNIRVFDVNGFFESNIQPSVIRIVNSEIDFIEPAFNGCELQITTIPFNPFPININNQLGCEIAQINTDPGGNFTIPNIDITYNDGTVFGQFAIPSKIDVNNATITAVTFSEGGCRMNINIEQTGSTGSGILYRQIIPSVPDVARTSRSDDSQGLFGFGYYDRPQNLTPISIAEIDYTATQSMVRETPATGTLGTDNISPTLLKTNNEFGNKLRFTDSLGNASDASVGSNIWAHVDWLNHSFSGAIDNYVIDHLTGDGYLIKYLQDGLLYNINVAGGTGKSWGEWLDYIATLSYSGFSDWVVIDASTDRPHYSKCNPTTLWADNFFIGARAPGEIAGQVDNRLSMLTGENSSISLNAFMSINDSSNNDMLIDQPKTGLGGFAGIIINAFCMRKHY